MKHRLLAFDNWLLERFPILWHTKLIYLLIIGVLLWIAYFATGYLLTDLSFLKVGRIKEYFFESSLIGIHLSLCLIIITFWALAFYKKSPLRYYYPTGGFYLLKQFIFLHIGFLPLAFCHIPFEAGMKYKTRKLVDIQAFNRELNDANLAIPFLPTHSSEYDLSNRIYPYPFPLHSITFDKNSNSWEKIDILRADNSYYHASNSPENTVVLADSNFYQFYTIKFRHVKNECGPEIERILDRFCKIPASTPVKSILNYSNITFDTTIVDVKNYYSMKTDSYQKQIIKRIHGWINANRKDLILRQIGKFEATLKKYEIPYFIKKEMWVRVLAKYNYQLPSYTVFNESLSQNGAKKLAIYYKKINGDFDQYLLDKESHYVFSLMGYNEYRLDCLKENCYWSYYKTFTFDDFAIVALLLSFALTLFLLLLNFAPLIQLIIAVPVGITLAILTSITAYFCFEHFMKEDLYGYSNYFYQGGYFALFFLIVMSAIIITSLISFKSKRFNKKLSGVLLCLSYAIVPGVLPVLLFTIDELSKSRIYSYCNGFYVNYTWLHSFIGPTTLILMSYSGFILFLGTVKWWFAKSE